jgi:epoxide hydrolase 4
VTLQTRTVLSGSVQLHCVSAGPEAGPLMLLLHGFPARWSTWRDILPALAAKGYLAVAPDLRGYGESDRPAGVHSYSIPRLVEDVLAIVGAYGRDRFYLVGHDFGGGVAWATAMEHPERVERLAIVNAIHPVGFERQIRKWSQLKKSWYVFFFLLPWIPEWWLSRKNFRFTRRSLADDGLPAAVIDDLVEGIRPRGALHAAINMFRASFRDGARRLLVPKKVELPTLVVWGDRERHFDAVLATPPADWVPNARVAHVPTGSHWVHHDEPEAVTALLIDHFR